MPEAAGGVKRLIALSSACTRSGAMLKAPVMRKTPAQEALEEAIAAAGSISALARALKINRQAVQSWERVPDERVEDVARITGVPKHRLRPDLFHAA
jgi:hypothetical protein